MGLVDSLPEDKAMIAPVKVGDKIRVCCNAIDGYPAALSEVRKVVLVELCSQGLRNSDKPYWRIGYHLFEGGRFPFYARSWVRVS